MNKKHCCILQDLGEPPLTSDSTLTFYIQDTDDMTPRFTHKAHHTSVIGERPVKVCDFYMFNVKSTSVIGERPITVCDFYMLNVKSTSVIGERPSI